MADVSVRPATGHDAPEIGRLQTETWQLGVPQDPAGRDPAQPGPRAVRRRLARRDRGPVRRVRPTRCWSRWRASTGSASPPSARTPTAQPEDPEPERTAAISALLVEPRWGRRGHGSRLLAAIADLARADGMRRLVAWVAGRRHRVAGVLPLGAGWAADGLQRGLDTGAGTVAEMRLHTVADRDRLSRAAERALHRHPVRRARLLRGPRGGQLQGVLDRAQAHLRRAGEGAAAGAGRTSWRTSSARRSSSGRTATSGSPRTRRRTRTTRASTSAESRRYLQISAAGMYVSGGDLRDGLRPGRPATAVSVADDLSGEALQAAIAACRRRRSW